MKQNNFDAFITMPSAFKEYEKEETRVSIGSAGKNAVSHLTFEKSGEKTHLVDVYSQVPAKVMRELYYDPYRPGLPYVLFVNPTGGIVQGDRYTYEFHLKEDAEAFITDTMATKIYKMDLNYASRRTDIYLASNSRLEYLPKEIIAFANSRWYQSINFHVKKDAKFLFSEIFCPGRIARGEFWDFDIFASRIMIENDGKLLLMDSATYRKEDKQIADIVFGNNTFLLNAYWYSQKAASAGELVEFESIYGGITEMPYGDGVIIKALSSNLDELKRFHLQLWRIFRKTEVGTETPDLRIY